MSILISCLNMSFMCILHLYLIKKGNLQSADDKADLTNYIANQCKPESTPEDKEKLLIEKSVLDMDSLLRTKVV